MKYSKIAAIIAFLFVCNLAMGQSAIKRLTQNTNTGLYVHYDKNTYISNETIWFNAYFLNSTKTTPEILSLFVVRHADKQIVADKKFVVGDFTSKGSITLPDSLQVGDYSIIAYGNYLVNDLPTYLHEQAISIKAPGRNVQSTMAVSAGFEKGRSIKFKTYPEGGKLVANVEQLIVLEAIDSLSRPVQTKAVLMENGKVIDTISINKEGFGRFKFTADAQKVYTLKSLVNNHLGVDTLIKAAQSGVVINIAKALTQDTLQLTLKSTQTSNVRVQILNKLSLLEEIKNIEIDPTKTLEIPLHNVPKGLQQIKVFDADNNLLAERLFYAHYSKDLQKINISTDKRQYVKRDSVTLSMMLPDGLDSLAHVSISVFHNNRMERSLFQDFEAQQYLRNDLRYWTMLKAGLDESLSEDVLISKYTISKETRFIENESRIGAFTGVAVMNKKPLKKPIPINISSSEGLQIFETDPKGNFQISDQNMISEDEKTVSLFVTGYLAPIVDIQVKDPFEEVNAMLVKNKVWNYRIPLGLQISQTDFIFIPNINKIEQVTISANNNSELFRITSQNRRNPCGDYVCKNGYLNCQIQSHDINTTLPIKGQIYNKIVISALGPSVVKTVYNGCVTTNQSMNRIEGFNIGKGFYGYDKDILINGEPLYDSTLYWSPETLLQKGKTENIGFHIGDVPGRYTIVVQGISNKGFVYAEAGFEVLDQ